MRPYLRVANVFDNRIDVSDVMSMNFEPDEFKRFRLRRGDILLNEGQSRHLVGRPAMFRDEVRDACFTNSLVRFRAGPRLVPEFALYLFRHYVYSGEFIKIAKWTTNIAHLGAERFASLSMPVPPLDVQQRIVAKLDELLAQSRAAREQLNAVPDLVEKYRQSVLAAAFRGDLTADWRKKNPDVEPASKLMERIRVERRRAWESAEFAKMKAKGKAPNDDKWKCKYVEPAPVDIVPLPQLPPTWCWTSLEMLTVGDRTSGYGVLKPGPHVADGVRLLKSGQVRDGSLDLTEDFRISEALSAQFARTVLRGGELLLNLVGASIGRSAIAPASLAGANVSRAIAVLPLRDDVVRWAQGWLMAPSSRRHMVTESGGSAQPVLNLALVRGLAVPLAPLAEREQVLSMAWSKLAGATGVGEGMDGSRIEILDRALLAKAFSGELVI